MKKGSGLLALALLALVVLAQCAVSSESSSDGNDTVKKVIFQVR